MSVQKKNKIKIIFTVAVVGFILWRLISFVALDFLSRETAQGEKVKIGNEYFIVITNITVPERNQKGDFWDSYSGLPDLFYQFLNEKGEPFFKSLIKRDSIKAEWRRNDFDLKRIFFSGFQVFSVDEDLQVPKIKVNGDASLVIKILDKDLTQEEEVVEIKIKQTDLIVGDTEFKVALTENEDVKFTLKVIDPEEDIKRKELF